MDVYNICNSHVPAVITLLLLLYNLLVLLISMKIFDADCISLLLSDLIILSVCQMILSLFLKSNNITRLCLGFDYSEPIISGTQNSWPSIFVTFALPNSTNLRLKIFKRECYVVADMYYAVRTKMVASVLNVHRLFHIIFF